MADFLEQLADVEVKPPPADFDRQLHARVNRALVLRHATDLVVGALPWAFVHFLQGVFAVALFSISGRYPEADRSRKDT